MSRYIIQMVDSYSGEILDTEDEVFDNEEDAEAYACECGGCFAVGAEVLMLSGREFTPLDDVRFVVAEMED